MNGSSLPISSAQANKPDSVPEFEPDSARAFAKLSAFPVQSELSQISNGPYLGVAPRPDQVVAIKNAVASELLKLEQLVEDNLLDRQSKCGAEIEYVLIDGDGRSVPGAQKLLALDSSLQKELSTCNVEATTTPVLLESGFLSKLESQLLAEHARVVALSQRCDCLPVLVGVLPSYQESDFLSDRFGSDRYRNLNRALLDRGESPNFRLRLSGIDQLDKTFSSILVQSLNTSFQLHLSAAVERLPLLYNICQLITAPLLSVAGNSSLVLGKRVWHESRIPIWEQAVDCGGKDRQHVFFGSEWITDPLAPLKDLKQFSPLVVPDGLDKSTQEISGAPELSSLRSLNGTVWRWNRLCYGLENGGPAHLRIENRYLPAGPTVTDMVANAAYFYGLVHGLEQACLKGEMVDPALSQVPFSSVERNFRQAAELGLGAEFTWIDGRQWRAQELNLKLLELAEQGLSALGVAVDESAFYLGVIRERVVTGQTGAAWQINSFNSLIERVDPDCALRTIATEMFRLQNITDLDGRNIPVHRWEVLS